MGERLTVPDHKGLVRGFTELGFKGSFSNGSGRWGHQFMQKGEVKVFIPNEHGQGRGMRDVALFLKLLRIAGISRQEWQNTQR
jgi:hypothetical protein